MPKITSDLNLYNTADRAVSKFVPLNPGIVGIYLCGATVQAPPHIGHIRSGVNFDILRRWLTAIGYDVTFVRNVTDIDDKILHKAVHEEIPWWAVAMKYERAFSDAYAALNAPGNGDVYLEVRKLKSYLTLSNQKLDDLLSADDADLTYKKDPRDFALWKAAKPGDPSWPTPWGDGRPGWHLECSAMAHAYLGEAFDIHGGGLDLIFPHHENEIAQSESAGWDFAKIWMHNAWVTTSGEKMSKSLGNSLQVMEILKKVRGIELRWYLGSAHYRSMLEFSFEALEESSVNFRRIEGFLQRAKGLLKSDIQPSISAQFTAAMNNDLAVPQALADISELVRIGNTAITDNDLTTLAKSASEVRGALEILGCDPFDPIFADSSNSKSEILDGLISLALEQRSAARERKDFAASDAIRDSLTALGITIEDTPTGSRWTVN